MSDRMNDYRLKEKRTKETKRRKLEKVTGLTCKLKYGKEFKRRLTHAEPRVSIPDYNAQAIWLSNRYKF